MSIAAVVGSQRDRVCGACISTSTRPFGRIQGHHPFFWRSQQGTFGHGTCHLTLCARRQTLYSSKHIMQLYYNNNKQVVICNAVHRHSCFTRILWLKVELIHVDVVSCWIRDRNIFKNTAYASKTNMKLRYFGWRKQWQLRCHCLACLDSHSSRFLQNKFRNPSRIPHFPFTRSKSSHSCSSLDAFMKRWVECVNTASDNVGNTRFLPQ